jgi:hypothetical protein
LGRPIHPALWTAARSWPLFQTTSPQNGKVRTMQKTLLALAAATLAIPTMPAMAEPPHLHLQ